GAVTGKPAAACTAASPVTGEVLSPAAESCAGALRSTTFAPAGGWTSTSLADTDPYEICVTASSRTGELPPCAKIAIRSGTPCSASHASSAEASKPPSCFGDSVTL